MFEFLQKFCMLCSSPSGGNLWHGIKNQAEFTARHAVIVVFVLFTKSKVRRWVNPKGLLVSLDSSRARTRRRTFLFNAQLARSKNQGGIMPTNRIIAPNDFYLFGYDYYIVPFSGGKDSLACFLYLLKMGISKEKIELWHHNVDGAESEKNFMDWPVTPAYCRAIAEAFNVQIYFSWKDGGFKGEMLRENSLTKPTFFETPEGLKKVGGTRGKKSTRLKFPQISADLKVRWCSAYLKIDICSTAIRNQARFDNKRTLVISGERAEESAARAKYKQFEPDRADNRDGKKRRLVDRFRAVHSWKEQDIWDIIKEFRVMPHPAYQLGFSRCSCMFCIFGNKDQFATGKILSPAMFHEIVEYEELFDVTIKRNKSISDFAFEGDVYEAAKDKDLREVSLSKEFRKGVFVENWELPSGAFGESCGPV